MIDRTPARTGSQVRRRADCALPESRIRVTGNTIASARQQQCRSLPRCGGAATSAANADARDVCSRLPREPADQAPAKLSPGTWRAVDASELASACGIRRPNGATLLFAVEVRRRRGEGDATAIRRPDRIGFLERAAEREPTRASAIGAH